MPVIVSQQGYNYVQQLRDTAQTNVNNIDDSMAAQTVDRAHWQNLLDDSQAVLDDLEVETA